MGNMNILDKVDVHKADPRGMIGHIEGFASLCEQAFDISERHSIPSYYLKAKKIVLLGMGGSGQAGDVIKNILDEKTDLIVESVHNYILPNFVDKDTLVIACSYSGDTEETLSGFISAYEKDAKMIAITSGGKLKILAEKYKVPVMQFDYKCPPRASFPFTFIFLLSVFNKLGYIENIDKKNLINVLTIDINKYQTANSLLGNPAKILAEKIYGKIPIIYTSEKLSGAGARLKAQFNENAKNFAFNEQIPETSHKSLEGLQNPRNMTFVIMLESNFEYNRNQIQQNITSEFLAKNRIPCERIKFLQAKDPVTEMFLQVIFGDFVSYYLAMLNKENPGVNDIIDRFKERLV